MLVVTRKEANSLRLATTLSEIALPLTTPDDPGVYVRNLFET